MSEKVIHYVIFFFFFFFFFCNFSSTDLSSLAHVLPPKDQVVKYVVLDGGEMDGRGHEERKGQAYIVVRSPAVSKNNVRSIQQEWLVTIDHIVLFFESLHVVLKF